MAGVFASAALEWGIRTLSSLLPATRQREEEDLEELARLERTMRRIHATLEDADGTCCYRRVRDGGASAAKLRLRELRGVAYDAEDVVGEYEYEVTQCKAEALERARNSGRHKRKRKGSSKEVSEDCSTGIAMVPILHHLAARAREIRERFNEITKEYEDLCLTGNEGDQWVELDMHSLQRQTSSIVHESSIHGREIDKKNVVEMLLSEVSPISVLAIVGMGGLDKTTLAQLVFNDPRVHQSFDKHAWICVSERFDVKIMTRNIISSLQKRKCDLVELDDLQGALIEQIKGKKFLLVLDDVWNEHRGPWDSFRASMMATELCKIVITTRNESVARLVQTMRPYSLNCLTPEESWSLFKQTAFEGQNPADFADLVQIGERIVEKCKGLPLAIKTLGSMLRYETNEEIWKDVLESELWDMDQPQKDILPALELSYKHMPVCLKWCFIALSLFPKDYHLPQDKVIHLWKSLGLLHPKGARGDDKIGRLYYNDLLQRSIIQYNDYCYTMHDLTHDLACFIAGEEFLRLEDDTPVEISEDVWNISIFLPWSDTISKLQHLHGSNALRSVIVSYKDGTGAPVEISEELFLTSKRLRTIILDGVSLNASLPDSMCNLKQLRCLVLADTGGLRLPISICRLFNLQTLDITTSCHMRPPCIPNGIGRLIKLHTLPVITIKRGSWHCNIRELKDLQNIGGELCIEGLDNVTSVDEAKEANLHSKQHLQALYLTFPDGDCKYCEHGQQPAPITISHEGILESLQPHHNLQKLSISVCKSRRYPSWLGDAFFSKLTRISLEYCEFECLPPLGQLPVLKSLSIAEMSILESIGPEFCSLDRRIKGFKSLVALEFDWMPRWSEWSGVEDGEFSCLHSLKIHHALELRSLPLVLSSSFAELNLRDCKNLTSIPLLQSLCKLELRQCNSLIELPALQSLHRLDLGQCNCLIRLPALPSLKVLILRDCPSLTAVVHLPLLTSIHLKGAFRDELLYSLLNSHSSLEDVLVVSETITGISLKPQNLPSLVSLRLSCPNLQYCDGLDGLTSLKELKIYGCPKLSIQNLLPSQL